MILVWNFSAVVVHGYKTSASGVKGVLVPAENTSGHGQNGRVHLFYTKVTKHKRQGLCSSDLQRNNEHVNLSRRQEHGLPLDIEQP